MWLTCNSSRVLKLQCSRMPTYESWQILIRYPSSPPYVAECDCPTLQVSMPVHRCRSIYKQCKLDSGMVDVNEVPIDSKHVTFAQVSQPFLPHVGPITLTRTRSVSSLRIPAQKCVTLTIWPGYQFRTLESGW